jgi:hypothetical protein
LTIPTIHDKHSGPSQLKINRIPMEKLMNNLELCMSAEFRSAVEKSVLLAREHHPKETGFSCWMDLDGRIIINEPVLGTKQSFHSHHQSGNIQQPHTGHREGEGSQSIIRFHTHPGLTTLRGWSDRDSTLAPSITDISSLLQVGLENLNIAVEFNRAFWVNPLLAIASPHATEWSLIQIDYKRSLRSGFIADHFWPEPVWELFTRSYPKLSKRGTGTIADFFGPERLQRGFGGFAGRINRTFTTPAFLLSSAKRYRELLDLAGITWTIIDPSGTPSTLHFSYKIRDFKMAKPEGVDVFELLSELI